MLSSRRYTTIKWVGSYNRCWRTYVRGTNTSLPGSAQKSRRLCVHWETDKGFKHQRLKNKANRALARSSKYTGGSATFMKTKARLSLNRNGTLAETFKYTHILKENKKRFADKQSQDHCDANGSTALVVDPDAVWRETASVLYKNRVYRLESFFASDFCTSTLRLSFASATSRAVNPDEDIHLRLQVQELTWSLLEQAQKLTDTQKRYQKIFTRVTVPDYLRLE
ncbi:hypothetical protein Ahy_A03g015176 [Arachis hypogaea]|uniref:Uncharacterized protein n=1 Tax=Arachis hypogaea TaxID=3818 RepID=A0A445DZW3_ARAHY|nr:hypothetical protein Ahy_A03g015176 [Arachis hypogaea]